MSGMKPSCIMKSALLACGFGIAALLFSIGTTAYAANLQVVIVNGSANHCLPYPSCYKPYEVDVRPGDTVTWVNDDNRTHTVTAGTPNYGPVGMFDSGPVPPGQSYTQFFGTNGKFPYYDKVDMWPSGIVVVSTQNQTRAEIGWVEGSLSVAREGSGPSQALVVRKQIENTGIADASSVIFRLRIINSTGFLFYDKIATGSVPARQNSTESFTWDSPLPGKYVLNFEADNLAKQENENNEVSSDLITVSNTTSGSLQPIIENNYKINGASSAVPEFGGAVMAALLLSMASVIGLSIRPKVIRMD